MRAALVSLAQSLDMRILVIRLSAMGDIVHALPAITDLRKALPQAHITLAVDERFVELAQMQAHADEVLSFPLKRWKRAFLRKSTWRELLQTLKRYREVHYDHVIDVHGVPKSAIVAWLAKASLRSGPDSQYSVGWLPRLIYQQACHPASWTPRTQWVRHIAAQSIGRAMEGPADFGLKLAWQGQTSSTIALVVNTAGAERLWKEAHWIELGQLIAKRGLRMLLPWGNAAERERVTRLIEAIGPAHCEIGPQQSLPAWAATLSLCRAVIGVDTGLLHIAAAIGVPCLGLFTTSDPRLLISQRQEWVKALGGPQSPQAMPQDACLAFDELLIASGR
jgi:heptosyltransferase-1